MPFIQWLCGLLTSKAEPPRDPSPIPDPRHTARLKPQSEAVSSDVSVSITGTLRRSRAEAIVAIGKAGARYVQRPSHGTDYLVAASLDTGKAKLAAECGVQVITEAEFDAYIAAERFPPRASKERFTHPNNFPEYTWVQELPAPRLALLKYVDSSGALSVRRVQAAGTIRGTNGREYVGAYDVGEFQDFPPRPHPVPRIS